MSKKPYRASNHRKRIVITGGPGGGKTTAADLFRREIGESVVVVPETATILFAGGFPRYTDAPSLRSVQTAIFHLQRNLEDVQSQHYPDRLLLCDRGTVDGAAYWPDEPADFFAAMSSCLEEELLRYQAVIFMETAGTGGLSIEGGNPQRVETLSEACQLDLRLRSLWSQHPRYLFIPHQMSFIAKIQSALHALTQLIH